MNNKKIVLVLVTLILTSIALIAFVYFFQLNETRDIDTEGNQLSDSVSNQLYIEIQDNSSFQSGLSSAKLGNYDEAISEYRKAVSEAQTSSEEAYIAYTLARATGSIDPLQAVKYFKEIIKNESYPSAQKAYAVVRLPLLLSQTSDPDVKSAILEGEPYSSFASNDGLTLYKNFYEYSLTFGSTGIAEFSVARWQAKQLLTEGDELSQVEKDNLYASIDDLLLVGNEYIARNETDPINAEFVPMVLRERARAYGVLAQIDYKDAREEYDNFFEEAVDANLLQKEDGPVRFDYVVYAFLNDGVESFDRTQRHLEILLNNIEDYPGMKKYFINEKNNLYNVKSLFVQIANANETFKTFLITESGWNESDFVL